MIQKIKNKTYHIQNKKLSFWEYIKCTDVTTFVIKNIIYHRMINNYNKITQTENINMTHP